MGGTTYFRRPGDRRPQQGPRTIYFNQAQWIDPYPWVQGSKPEKMVMAELVRRGIYFEHTPQTNSLQWSQAAYDLMTSDPKKMEADFLFPQYRIWLEVQGFYFHTLKGAPESDALRFVLIEQAGYRPIYWWDYDILARLNDLMDAVPEFYHVNGAQNKGGATSDGLPFLEGGDGIDHLAGLRSMNRGRARTPQYEYKGWSGSNATRKPK